MANPHAGMVLLRAHSGPMKLLLVEDDAAMAQALQLALERRGFDVTH